MKILRLEAKFQKLLDKVGYLSNFINIRNLRLRNSKVFRRKDWPRISPLRIKSDRLASFTTLFRNDVYKKRLSLSLLPAAFTHTLGLKNLLGFDIFQVLTSRRLYREPVTLTVVLSVTAIGKYPEVVVTRKSYTRLWRQKRSVGEITIIDVLSLTTQPIFKSPGKMAMSVV